MKKNFKELSWQVDEDTYRADSAYSYSTLARFNREGFEGLSTLFNKVESPSLTFGSMVDSILTGGMEEFNSRFIVADLPQLEDKLILILKNIFNPDIAELNEIPYDTILTEALTQNYHANWKNETKVKVIIEQGTYYYQLLHLSNDKQIVSSLDYQDAINCVNELKTSPMTEWYFQEDNIDSPIERFYQLKFKATYNNIPIRIMADLIIVDHEAKEIIPCDLKTSSKKEYKFYKSFIDWSYYIQAQLYAWVIQENIKNDPFYKDYKIKDYRFITINRYNLAPLVWEYPDTKAMTTCYYGKDKSIECKNWRELLCNLYYYLEENPGCKYPLGISEINNIKQFLNE